MRVSRRPVDSAVDAPYAGFMNLQVPPELEAKLTRLATETGRSVDQVALDLLASSIDHDEWFRAEVEKGRTAVREVGWRERLRPFLSKPSDASSALLGSTGRQRVAVQGSLRRSAPRPDTDTRPER